LSLLISPPMALSAKNKETIEVFYSFSKIYE
jgi:hypothetical protein